jgi:hypothetical protein
MISAKSSASSFPNDASVIVVSITPRTKGTGCLAGSLSTARVRSRASAGGTEHALEGQNVLCWHQLSHRGARRSGQRNERSVARDVKRAQVGLRSLGYVYRCDRTRCSSLSFSSVIASFLLALVNASGERQTRRNAEGARPVAVLKVVAKC